MRLGLLRRILTEQLVRHGWSVVLLAISALLAAKTRIPPGSQEATADMFLEQVGPADMAA